MPSWPVTLCVDRMVNHNNYAATAPTSGRQMWTRNATVVFSISAPKGARATPHLIGEVLRQQL
jgi:hypothetical protein